MSDEQDSGRLTSGGLRYRLKKWWHGGESGRQHLRRATGVYRSEEGFEKPENPEFHWTAKVVRVPIRFFQAHIGAIIATVLATLLALFI